MATIDCAQIISEGLATVIHGMNQTHATVNGVLETGAAHYAENARIRYLSNLDNISFAQATGQRLVTEAGSGRTRAETNAPGSTSAGGT